MSGPDRAAGAQAHAVPYDVKMLAAILDVLDDDALMLTGLVAVLFFKPLAYPQDLRVSKPLVLHRIDADVMQRLRGACRPADHPHVAKSFVEVFDTRLADFDQADFLVASNRFEVIGGGAIAAADMAFDNHVPRAAPPLASTPPHMSKCFLNGRSQRNQHAVLPRQDDTSVKLPRDLIKVIALCRKLPVHA